MSAPHAIDAGSRLASCTSPTYSGPDSATASLTATCTDQAGNSSSATYTFQYDTTAPTVTNSGNAGTYAVDQQVAISCTPADTLSGIAASTCQANRGPAYSFGLGTHSSSATARDNAGNIANGSTSFTVTLTPAALKTRIARFCTDPLVTASLRQEVNAIVTASSANAKGGALAGFTNLVKAQTGKSLTSAEATTLITLAKAL